MWSAPLNPSPLFQGACSCGACQFQVHAQPLARFICHCTICQAYTGQAFSDVTLLRAKHVTVSNMDKIAFKKYRLPPNIARGSCLSCGKPVLEFGGFGPLKLAFIPTSNYIAPQNLPPAAMHIFYHRRVAAVDDTLPKYSGYLNSEWAVARLLMK